MACCIIACKVPAPKFTACTAERWKPIDRKLMTCLNRQGCGKYETMIYTRISLEDGRWTVYPTSQKSSCLDPVVYFPFVLLPLTFESIEMTTSTARTSPTQFQAELRILLGGPAMSPPAGVIPAFDHAPNLDIYVTMTITWCVIVATLAVLLRMYTKVFILRVLAWEDCVFTSTSRTP